MLPGESAMGHFAHEAGKGIQPGGVSDGYSLKKGGEYLLAGWRMTLRERASWNKQKNAPCFVKAATSGAVMYLPARRSMLGNFAGSEYV